MKRSFTTILISAALSLSMCGCSGVFEKEYLVVEDYVAETPNVSEPTEKISVRTYSQLKQAIMGFVIDTRDEGTIIFDPAYDGDVSQDIASACWELRTEDALCMYCVENMAYEVSQIVTYYEAKVSISYGSVLKNAGKIVNMQYYTGLDDALNTAFEEGKTKLVVLINRSNYSADNISGFASQAYRKNPGIAPREPRIDVNMFSGNGLQRLYEINISYGLPSYELRSRQEELLLLEPFRHLDTENMDESQKALAACRYLAGSCVYSEEGLNTIYSALITGESNSEGMAFAYVELCQMLGIDCQIVYGQRNWQDHCWNIIEIDGQYYHVDPSVCAGGNMEGGFLRSDENIWEVYRWDVSSYPDCDGELTYENLTGEN